MNTSGADLPGCVIEKHRDLRSDESVRLKAELATLPRRTPRRLLEKQPGHPFDLRFRTTQARFRQGQRIILEHTAL